MFKSLVPAIVLASALGAPAFAYAQDADTVSRPAVKADLLQIAAVRPHRIDVIEPIASDTVECDAVPNLRPVAAVGVRLEDSVGHGRAASRAHER